MNKPIIATALGIATVSLAAACGGSSSGGSSAQVRSTPVGHTATGVTLAARSVPHLQKVLVNSSGMAVYTPAQEASGHILCTGSCTAVWRPVTVPAGSMPVAGTGVTAHVGTMKRPDGTTQVTAAGKPLYTFSLDQAPGSVTGNGAKDSFNGTSFTWHAVASSGAVASSSSASTPSPASSSGGGYGGYSY